MPFSRVVLANGDDSGVLRFLRNAEDIRLLRIVIIVAAAALLIALVKRALPWLAARAPSRLRLSILPSVPVLRLVVLVVAVVLLVPEVVNPTFRNLVAILGAIGLAVGFALKDYISSLLAGIVAIYERPYRPGDWVEIDGTYGEVTSVGLRALTVVTPNDDVVMIPHGTLWDTNIYNANRGRRDLMCVADFYLHPRHDAAAVRRTLRDVALTSPYTRLQRPIAVIVSETPWGTHYRLKAYPFDGRDQFQFTSDLTVRGKAALARLGAEPVVVPAAVRGDPEAGEKRSTDR